MSTDYIRTVSGIRFPVEPTADAVSLEDISTALSRAPRWGGHSRFLYPVSAHSIFVSRLLPKPYKLQGLLHDASEAYLADIPSPFKALLPDYKKLEERLMIAVSQKFRFEWPMAKIVKSADAVALYEERKRLFPDRFVDDVPTNLVSDHPRLDSRVIQNWDWNWWLSLSHEAHDIAFRMEFNTAYYE